MRAINIGDLDPTVAIQISRNQRRQPPKTRPDIGRRRDHTVGTINRQPRAPFRVALNGDDLHHTVPIDIKQPWRRIFKDRTLWQRQPPHRACLTLQNKRTPFNRIAQCAMRIALGGGFIACRGNGKRVCLRRPCPKSKEQHERNPSH